MFSNKYFDPAAGSRLCNEYLDHYLYAEEMGLEGIMLNVSIDYMPGREQPARAAAE
jgi:hypothetical protein